MLKGLRRVASLCVMGFALSVLAVYAFALLNPSPPPGDVQRSDVIVVLGAGMDADGTLHRSSVLRVETGVALWQADAGDTLHFTGGRGRADGPSAGEQMAALAVSLGVDPNVVSHEDRSLSTLQNAYYSQPMIGGAERLRLVTEGFHLPRSWLSFKWAAWHRGHASPRIYLSHSERLRRSSHSSSVPQVTMVLREAAAFWFNTARLIGFELAGVFGAPLEVTEPWLD